MDSIVRDCVKVVGEYNNISSVVNGTNSVLVNEIRLDVLLSKDNYFIRNYINSSLDIIANAKSGDYKSKVSDSMKAKLVDNISVAKKVLSKLLEDVGSIIYKEERARSFTFIEENSKESITNVVNKFNSILKTEGANANSSVPAYIANHYYNNLYQEETTNIDINKVICFIMMANIKLTLLKRKILFSDRPKEEREDIEVKDIKYPLNIDFKLSSIPALQTRVVEEEKDILDALSINTSLDAESKFKNIHGLMASIQKSYKSTYDKSLITMYGEYEKSDIVSEEEFIYSLKNLQSDSIISGESGINTSYVAKTKTISRFKNEELVEDYISPISLKNNKMKCYNWIDIYDSQAEASVNDVLILVKKFDKYMIFYGFRILDNLQLLEPELINVDVSFTKKMDNAYENNLNEMIPDLYSDKSKINKDLGIFTPVKMGNVRHRMIEYLKKYNRIQDKTQNTDNLIEILFNSIYEEIWDKTPKINNFSDEFYLTFYSSISRMVFKMRKDIMDRYNIMKDFETAKPEMTSLLEKVEKNIMKIDNNLYTIYKITN